MFIDDPIITTGTPFGGTELTLDGTFQLEFRSSERRRRVLGPPFYKHLTPNGMDGNGFLTSTNRLIPNLEIFLFVQILQKNKKLNHCFTESVRFNYRSNIPVFARTKRTENG